jgi:hypothetical protein
MILLFKQSFSIHSYHLRPDCLYNGFVYDLKCLLYRGTHEHVNSDTLCSIYGSSPLKYIQSRWSIPPVHPQQDIQENECVSVCHLFYHHSVVWPFDFTFKELKREDEEGKEL